jgi:hypothetical protein
VHLNAIRQQFQEHRQRDPLGTESAMYVVPLVKPQPSNSSGSRSAEEAALLTTAHTALLPELWNRSQWTRSGPSLMLLQRLQKLALASLDLLLELPSKAALSSPPTTVSSMALQVFEHPTQDYDVLLHLKADYCTRLVENEPSTALSSSVTELRGILWNGHDNDGRRKKDHEVQEEVFKNLQPLVKNDSRVVGSSKSQSIEQDYMTLGVYDPVAMYMEDLQVNGSHKNILE